jgi:hypothetical protein
VSDQRERVENDDWASYTVHFANGATGNLSASRIAFGHPNTLKFEVFFEQGALAFDVSRPGEFAIATGGLPGDSNGFRRVIVGIDHPYVAAGLAIDATGSASGLTTGSSTRLGHSSTGSPASTSSTQCVVRRWVAQSAGRGGRCPGCPRRQ